MTALRRSSGHVVERTSARGGTRTHTAFRLPAPKTGASASSATFAHVPILYPRVSPAGARVRLRYASSSWSPIASSRHARVHAVQRLAADWIIFCRTTAEQFFVFCGSPAQQEDETHEATDDIDMPGGGLRGRSGRAVHQHRHQPGSAGRWRPARAEAGDGDR